MLFIMKQLKIEKFTVPICILLFNLLFWSEKMGLNALLFTLVIIGVLLRKHKEEFTFPLLATIAGTLIAAGMVVVNNSQLSKTVLFLSSFVMAGFFHRSDLKFIGFSFLATLRQLFASPYQLLSWELQPKTQGKSFGKSLSGLLTFGLIPLFIFGCFLFMYCMANNKFAKLVFNFMDLIFSPSTSNYSFFTFDQFMFFLLSLFLVGALLLKPVTKRFAVWQTLCKDNLERQRRGKKFGFMRFSMLALRREYKVGLIMMIALNALLLVVNLTDIVYVWFNFEPMSARALSKYVHEGTYILIISIFWAMGVVLYYFRKNINFLGGIKPLKYLALAWIIQNVVLAFSVGMRNYHYIREYGLASKRIGVIFFLILTIIGLLLMWVKVRDRKSVYFLVDRTAWALYGMLIFLTFFNWDVLMTRYNLAVNSNKSLDVVYLASKLSDKNLHILLEHKDAMKNRAPGKSNWLDMTLKNKKYRFHKMQDSYSVLSWNYRDWQVKRALKDKR